MSKKKNSTIKKKYSNTNSLATISQTFNYMCGVVFFAAISMFMPLYYENKYFNMLQAKGHVIQNLIYYLLPISIVIFIVAFVLNKREKMNWQLNYMDISLIVYGIATLVAWIGCDDRKTSLWGSDIWFVGAAVMIGLVVFYLLVSRSLYFGEKLWIPVGAVNGIIFVISILHSAGIDVFHLHERIVAHQYYKYISTIGNVNWFSAYLCLLVPLFIVLFLNSEQMMLTMFYAVVCFLAMINVVLCASDSVFVGIGICLFFMVPFLLDQEKRMQRIMIVLSFYGIGLLLIGNVPCFAGKRAVMDGISEKLLSLPVSLGLTVIGIAGYLAAKKWWNKLSQKTIKILICILDGAILLVIIVMVVYNIRIFNDMWGTKRGYIWKETIRVFGSFDLQHKLFGVGPELLGNCYQGIFQYFSYQVLCAHNEFLQYLLSVGLFGLFAWIAMWVGLIIEFFKKKIWKTNRIALFLPLMAYLGQSFFNSPMALTISLLFLMLTCYRRSALDV